MKRFKQGGGKEVNDKNLYEIIEKGITVKFSEKGLEKLNNTSKYFLEEVHLDSPVKRESLRMKITGLEENKFHSPNTFVYVTVVEMQGTESPVKVFFKIKGLGYDDLTYLLETADE